MNVELIIGIRQRVERARVACQSSGRCKQQSVRLVLASAVLIQRCDELQDRILLKAAVNSPSQTESRAKNYISLSDVDAFAEAGSR